MNTHMLEASPLKVLKRRENGSGVIEIPITAVTAPDVDAAIDSEMLQEIAANFARFSLVPVGVTPHREFGERGDFSPAFIDSVEIRGDTLYGQVDLIAPLFAEVVEMGGWRGFSVELVKNLSTQAMELDGWVLTGGVFTNRPAILDAHFKLAAEAVTGSDSTGVYTVPISRPPKGEERIMAEKADAPASGAAMYDAKIKAKDSEILKLEAVKADLTRELESARNEARELRLAAETATKDARTAKNDKLAAEAKSNQLDAEAQGLRTANGALKAALTEKEMELQEQTSVNLTAKVLAVRDAALERGVVPALFDGIEADPASWMTAKFASFEAFEEHYTALSGVSRDLMKTTPKSGHDPKGSGERTEISAEAKKRLKRMGLNPKYVGIRSESELFELNDTDEN